MRRDGSDPFPRGVAVLLGLVVLAAGVSVRLLTAGDSPEEPPATPSRSPAPSSSPSPSPSTRAAARTGPLTIRGVGDVNLDPEYVSGLAEKGFAWAWAGVGDVFRTDDVSVANLECPATDLPGRKAVKTYVFRCDPDGLGPMAEAGIDVANLANNHSLDLGRDALIDTRRNVLAAGMQPTGAGTEQEAYTPAIFPARGRFVAVLGFTATYPDASWRADGSRAGVADGKSLERMKRAIRVARKAADVVVVTIHWGVERSPNPTAEQRRRARALVDAGADVIFGHHAHVLQPLEMYKGRPIFYGLGNFVWRRSWPESYTTAVADVTVDERGRYRAKLLPAYIVSSGHPEMR